MEEICGKAINVQEVLVQIIAVKAGSIPSPKHLDFRSTPELTPMMGDCHVLCTCWPKTYVVLFAPTPTFNFQPFSKTKRLGVISRLRWGSYSTSSTFRCSHDWVPKTKALVQSLVLLQQLQDIPQHQQAGVYVCVSKRTWVSARIPN